MVKRIPWFFLLFGLILIIPQRQPPVAAQIKNGTNRDYQYFAETGHSVSNDFLMFYRSVPDPEIIFGYPITEAFLSTTSGRVIQYFDKARFELFPEDPPEMRVKATLLGTFLHNESKLLPVPDNFPSCKAFPETGFKVCYSFLDFFLAHGGAPIFGYPISNFEIDKGIIVQFFQRAKMEWHPENPPGKRVVLADIGKEYFNLIKEDTRRLIPVKPLPDSNLPNPILGLQLQAYPERAVLPTNGDQVLYIIVQDQNNIPVPEAFATLIITFPSKRVLQEVAPQLSDQNGIIRFPFHYEDEKPGITTIDVTVNYPFIPEARTVASFRIWW